MLGVVVALRREIVVELLRERLGDLPRFVKAVLLFGSVARGEACGRSDVDLLVLHEGMPIRDLVCRRRYLYRLIMDRVGDVYDAVTLIDMELQEFMKPGRVTPLLLNIYWDAVIVLDRTCEIEQFLEYVRRRIREVGLVRVKDGKAYYWVLPEPIRRVELL